MHRPGWSVLFFLPLRYSIVIVMDRRIHTSSIYQWTHHAKDKLRQYRLSESRIKRIIRHPLRIEEGIAEGAVAAMQPAGGKNYSEIWTMYVPKEQRIIVITAWRYPGKSSERDPVPQKILSEARSILGGI